MQNWQSEFLAVGCLVVLGIVLRQHASPESKPVTEAGAELTVDLSAFGFCDSACIGALVALRKQCEDEGWFMRTVHPQQAVRRILVDFTGLGEYLNVL
jgi:anti-anti-sigma factor